MWREILIGLASASVGYFVATKVLQSRYDEMLDLEIARTREFFESQEKQVEEAVEAFSQYTGVEEYAQRIAETEEQPEYPKGSQEAAVRAQDEIISGITVTPDVFESKVQQTNYARIHVPETEAIRQANPVEIEDARAPYIITFAEFDANETDYVQLTVSYFAGDGIVIDEDDAVIDAAQVEKNIGTDNLNKFGTNTDDPDMDPNSLYVRCEEFGIDYEITRSPGKYSVEVLGEAR